MPRTKLDSLNENKKRMTFNRTEEIKREQDENRERVEMLNARKQEAAARLALVKRQYDEALTEGVKKGEDNTKELDKLAAKIEDAEKVAARRANEALIAENYFQTIIDRKGLENEFQAWRAEYKKTEVEPIFEKIRYLKRELTLVMREYKEVEAHYEAEKGDFRSLIDPAGKIIFDIFGDIRPSNRRELEKYFITANTLQDLERNQIPKGVDLNESEEK